MVFGKKKEKNQESGSLEAKDSWERDVLSRLAFAAINEQRKSRLWNTVFKAFFVIYIGFFLIVSFSSMVGTITSKSDPHTAIINIKGAISSGSAANAADVNASLQEAFINQNAHAIILQIDSPGGSPVQSGYIYDEIMRLKNKYPDKKLYAVIADTCASGGYYIASAADMIYANRASLVGSIGVRMGSFGFSKVMEEYGIERRTITSGEHKTFMDPFSPVNPDDVAHTKELVAEVHQQFIDAVKRGRGNRLAEDEKLFSGLLWTGTQSLELGLIDGLADTRKVAEDIIEQPNLVSYSQPIGLIDQLFGKLGVAVSTVASPWL